MQAFEYTGRNKDGSPANGRLEANSKNEAASQLLAQQITPLTFKEVTGGPSAIKNGKETNKKQLFEKVDLDELIMFSRQMASLNRAGVAITTAMRGLADTVDNPLLARTLNESCDDLEKGYPLATTLSNHPKVFNEFYVSMIHVGENTGALDQSFRQMSKYLELERQTIKSIKQATRYPMFVMIAIAVAMGVINVFVIPAFKSVFNSFGGELPWQTQALIAISDFTVNYWYLLIGGLVAALFAFSRWKKTPSGLMRWDQMRLRFPIIGSIFYRATLGRFARAFSVVLKAGMPLEQGLSIVSRSVGNKYLGEKIAGMRRGIDRGEAFTQTAYTTGMFSPLVLQMLSVGEETGRVDEMLAEVADFYEEEVEYALKNLTSVIEPILITTIGIMVLILALGVFLPLWELSTTING